MRRRATALIRWTVVLLTCCLLWTATADEYVNGLTPLDPVVARTEQDFDRLRTATMVMEARILERSGEAAKALRKYQRAWRLDPDARVVLQQIVPLALELGHVAEATRYSLLLTNSDLDDPFLAERMAMLMSEELEYDRSLQLYQRVLQLLSNDPNSRNPIAMHFEMGRLYFLTDKHEQAAQSFRVVRDALESPTKHGLSERIRAAILAKPELAYGLMAESFLEAGDYEAARAMFRKANSADDEQSEGWLPLQLARVDYRAGEYRQAQERLEAYMKQRFRFGGQTPYALLRDLMTGVRDKDKPTGSTAPRTDTENVLKAQDKSAIARFRDWLSDDPDNYPLISFVADMTRKEGGLQDAAALYEKSVANQPTLEAYQALIQTYRKLGQADKLVDTLGRVTANLNSLDPFSDEIKLLVADPQLLQNVYANGRTRLQANRTFGEGVATACGLIAIEAEDYEVADEFFAGVGDAPQTGMYVTWGLELLGANQHARAVRVFESGLDTELSDDDRAIFLFYLAGALQLDGKTEAALEAANAAVRLRPQVPDFSLRPAWIQYNAGNHAKAKAAYTTWLDKYSDEFAFPGVRESVRDAKFVMSSICVQEKQLAVGIEWLEQVLDEFPTDVGAMNDLGYLLIDHKLATYRAAKMIRKAVEAEPDNLAYRDSWGWALYRMGRHEEAIVELQKALGDASEETLPDPVILDHLADAQFAADKTAAATRTWQRALELISIDSPEDLETRIEAKLKQHLVESK